MEQFQQRRYNPGIIGPVSAKPAERVQLFCFPHSGASAAMFNPWVTSLPGPITVRPVELPGHGQRLREGLLTQLPNLIEAASAAITPYLDQPFAFFGHSMGALISFELARHLRLRFHREPLHLFVSGHTPPHLPHHEPPIHNLPDEAFVQKIREMNGTEEDFFASRELREVFLPILRADFQVCETYQYRAGEPLTCPITALGGLKDQHVSRATLEAWQVHTRSAFRVRMFPGDHFFLNQNRSTLLEVLARELISAFSAFAPAHS